MVRAKLDAEAPLLDVISSLRSQGLADPDPSRNTVYQAICNTWHDELQGEVLARDRPLRSPGVLHCAGGQVDVQLQLQMVQGGARKLKLGYYADVFAEHRMECMASDLKSLMSAVVTSSTQLAWELPLNGFDKLTRNEAADATNLPFENDVRRIIGEVVAGGAPIPDDVPLTELGLDSTSSAFLRDQLSQLAQVSLPRSFTKDHPTICSIANALAAVSGPSDKTASLPSETRETFTLDQTSEPRVGAPVVQVRLVGVADWPALQDLWRRYHHLLEMVSITTHVLLWGLPAWFVVVFIGALVGQMQVFETWRTSQRVCVTCMVAYVAFVVLLHSIHLICAKATLSYDLRQGDLTPDAWISNTELQCAVFVAEALGQDRALAGVVCVKLQSMWGSQPKQRDRKPRNAMRRRGKEKVSASLWHATVAPPFRNRGTASALVAAAEVWALEHGADTLEALCLNGAAKAAALSSGFELRNPRIGAIPLLPAVFLKRLG